MPSMTRTARPAAPALAVVAVLAVLLTACGADGPDLPVSGVDAQFVAEVASYQQVVEEPSRFAVGLIGASGRWVSFGNATLTFSAPDGSDADPPDPVVAGFLPLPGSPDPEADPALTLASSQAKRKKFGDSSLNSAGN